MEFLSQPVYNTVLARGRENHVFDKFLSGVQLVKDALVSLEGHLSGF